MGEGLEIYFRDGWHLRDERTRGLPLIKSQGIFVDHDFASDKEISTSDYYRGFLAKFEFNWSAVVGFSDPDDEWCLVFERGDKQGFFDQREQADLVRFAAPLGQAAALARSVAYTNAASAMDAYQSLGCASFLIDQLGRSCAITNKLRTSWRRPGTIAGGSALVPPGRQSWPQGVNRFPKVVKHNRSLYRPNCDRASSNQAAARSQGSDFDGSGSIAILVGIDAVARFRRRPTATVHTD
jgi:hypothetical protein